MLENNVKTYIISSQTRLDCETAMLALKDVKLGDIVRYSELDKSYINRTGNNTSTIDWQELVSPIGKVKYHVTMITACTQCPHYFFDVIQICQHPQWASQFHPVSQYPIPDDCPLSEKRD